MHPEIELRQMQYFLAVAEERNFTRAARRCHVAQPSLSKQIHGIEQILGTKLIERLPREARLTDAGETFRAEADKVIEHALRAVSRVRALNRGNQQALQVGISILCDLPRMQTLVSTARNATKECSVELTHGTSPQLVIELLRGDLDLAIVDTPIAERNISTLPIHSEPLAAFLPERHPLYTRPVVRIFELRREQLVLLNARIDPGASLLEEILHKSGVETSVLHWVSSLIELLDEVAQQRYIGLVRNSARRLRREGVISKPVSGSVQLETSLAWRTDNRNPALLSFRDAVVAFSRRTSTDPAA